MPCDGDWGGATVGLGLQGGGWIRGSSRGVAGGSQCLLVLCLRLLAWEARCAACRWSVVFRARSKKLILVAGIDPGSCAVCGVWCVWLRRLAASTDEAGLAKSIRRAYKAELVGTASAGEGKGVGDPCSGFAATMARMGAPDGGDNQPKSQPTQ